MTGAIAELQWATAAIPLRRPVQAGALVITSREYCCVRATLASGVAGEAFVLTRGLDVDGALERLFAAPTLAASAHALDVLRTAVRNVGWDGAISRAASAVRLAVLDAVAREHGAPVWRELGAHGAPSARAVVVIGYATPGEDPAEADLRGARDAVAAGATCLKLMGGSGAPDDDLRRIAHVRAAVGEGIDIALDVNGAWSLASALAALPRLAEAGVTVVEEPWAYERGLASFEDLPAERPELAFGEVSASVIELEALAATGCVEHLRPDATLAGGAEAWRELAPALRSAGVAVFPHFWPEVHRHLVALVPRVSYLECASPRADEFGLEALITPLVSIDQGRIVAPNRPGFGFELDWEQIVHCADTQPRRRAA
jgi:L-alanine-DL-glutamate epimerase-like enolase superfamily enzyme